mgnify:CR=1 FL=1
MTNLITTSQRNHDFSKLTEKLKSLDLKGELVGFIQTINDDFSDQVSCDEMKIYHGRNHFYDQLLNNKFKIDSLSFFQTNTKGAELLYSEAEKYISSAKNKVVYDLYCGAGTISQSIAADAAKIYGIEIDQEAAERAAENAKLNEVQNTEYISGDVLEKINEINQRPDLLIIDPPRPGINPKALTKIAAVDAAEILYISCNPKSLARDLKELKKKKANGEENGIEGLEIIGQTELFEKEPNINRDAKYALYAPTAGIISPYELTIGYADNAVINGTKILLDTEVTNLIMENDNIKGIKTNQLNIRKLFILQVLILQ